MEDSPCGTHGGSGTAQRCSCNGYLKSTTQHMVAVEQHNVACVTGI